MHTKIIAFDVSKIIPVCFRTYTGSAYKLVMKLLINTFCFNIFYANKHFYIRSTLYILLCCLKTLPSHDCIMYIVDFHKIRKHLDVNT